YYSFNNYLGDRFGAKVRRLSLAAGFTCPNRDGTLSNEGCIYCNEEGFSPFVAKDLSLARQIEESMAFAVKRYGAEKFIAYFQNATGTYAPVAKLKETYDIIRDYPDIVGLFISTRPDCIDSSKLDLIKRYTDEYEVWIEYGIGTVHDGTLEALNRKHTFAESRSAIEKTAERGIKVGVHVILGLPGETASDMMETACRISDLPVSGVKFHVFHVLVNTRLEAMFASGKIKLLDMEEYVSIISGFIERLPRECVVLRLVSDAKKEFLVAPEWMRHKENVISSIRKRLEELDTYQGIKKEGSK
ncbi:MAG: TIGR01212 family radical SAM protein, partial [Candidatus Omnitrophica bacterium]|nr:TIGR01212 family radical SAM protein [Candidatus Omnitrophota bacterium]